MSFRIFIIIMSIRICLPLMALLASSLLAVATTAMVAWNYGFDRHVGPARSFDAYSPVYLVSLAAMCLLYTSFS